MCNFKIDSITIGDVSGGIINFGPVHTISPISNSVETSGSGSQNTSPASTMASLGGSSGSPSGASGSSGSMAPQASPPMGPLSIGLPPHVMKHSKKRS
ncbi:hypothetical protein [Priestia koreensis]|uniref:hypothetical protein n=1 Tax=Priestia koreensis TaxID=284581 RepID=UPI0034585CD9